MTGRAVDLKDIVSRNLLGYPESQDETIDALKSVLDCGLQVRAMHDALCLAIWRGGDRVVRFLLERGADPNALPPALFVAVGFNRLEIMRILLDYGADVNLRSKAGWTALHKAVSVMNKPTGVIQFLLDNGADVNAQDVNGNTPLHKAVEAGNTEVVRLLLEHGADPVVRNGNGKTPVDLARWWTNERKRNELLSVFRCHDEKIRDKMRDRLLEGIASNNVDLHSDDPVLMRRL